MGGHGYTQPKIHGPFHACYGPVTGINPRGVFNCLVRYCLAACGFQHVISRGTGCKQPEHGL